MGFMQITKSLELKSVFFFIMCIKLFQKHCKNKKCSSSKNTILAYLVCNIVCYIQLVPNFGLYALYQSLVGWSPFMLVSISGQTTSIKFSLDEDVFLGL